MLCGIVGIGDIVMGKTFIEICYGRKQEFPESKRRERADFYYEGMVCCDGCESQRYMNLYTDLVEGRVVCTDDYYGDEEYDKAFPEIADKMDLVRTGSCLVQQKD